MGSAIARALPIHNYHFRERSSMKRSPIIIVVVITLVAGGAAVFASMSKDNNSNAGGDMTSMNMSGGDTSEAEAMPNEVFIKDFAFAPGERTVKKGTKVTWTNKDSARHDISPTSGGSDFKASELLAKGESYSFTFNTAGTYTYKCSPHPYMKGTVVVTE